MNAADFSKNEVSGFNGNALSSESAILFRYFSIIMVLMYFHPSAEELPLFSFLLN